MKYDFGLDMDNENSVSIILEQIRPGSKVLEFGPAMGRMTKYLKEKLSCEVYIIELDEEGYNNSIKYAADGYLGNAETNEWAEKFKGIKFEYIIFADVIEHLRNPEKVLLNAKKLLDFEGKIIVSVPNVAHNSVIIDLINNKFNYSKIGLLDNTHIKFFTYYSLQDMLSRCNFIISNERATYAQPNETELLNNYDMISRELADTLKTKEFGDNYQFIFTCVKKEDYLANKENIIIEKNIKKITPTETFKVYVNDGSGLNENKVLIKQIFMGKNRLNFNLGSFSTKNEIRLDFTEDSCIVKLDKLSVNGDNYDIKRIDGNYSHSLDNYYVFLNNDPYLFIKELPIDCKSLFIEFSIYKLHCNEIEIEYFNAFESMLKTYFTKSENDNNSLIKSNKVIIQLNDKLEENEVELRQMKNKLSKNEVEFEQMKNKLSNNEVEFEQMKNKLSNNEVEFEQMKNKLSNNEVEFEQMKNKLSNNEVEFEQMKNKLSNNEVELIQMKNKVTQLEDELELDKNEVIKLNKELKINGESAYKLNETIKEKDCEIKILQYECFQKNETINSLRSELEKLNSSVIMKLNKKIFNRENY